MSFRCSEQNCLHSACWHQDRSLSCHLESGFAAGARVRPPDCDTQRSFHSYDHLRLYQNRHPDFDISAKSLAMVPPSGFPHLVPVASLISYLLVRGAGNTLSSVSGQVWGALP